MEFFLVALDMMFGGLVQTITGFGSGTFSMVFMPDILGSMLEATAVTTALGMLGSFSIWFKNRRYTKLKLALVPAIGYFTIMPLASYAVIGVPTAALKPWMGALLLATSLYFSFFNGKIKVSKAWYAAVIAGGIGGAFSGMFGMGGLPMAIYYINAVDTKEEYMGTSQLYFTINCVYATTIRACLGIINVATIPKIGIGAVGLMLGVLLGLVIVKRLPVEVIRKLLYGFVGVCGIVLIVEALL